MGACLQSQRFSISASQQGAWQYTYRSGTRQVAKSSTSGSLGNSKRNKTLGLTWNCETSKPTLSDALHPTKSPSNPSQVVPLPDDQAFKYESIGVILIEATITTNPVMNPSMPAESLHSKGNNISIVLCGNIGTI